MNSKKYLIGLLALLTMAGCSSDDTLPIDGSEAIISDGKPRYLSVNLTDVNGSSSMGRTARATTNATSFTSGSNTEDSIRNVRFYFFNADGTAAHVKYTTTESGTGYVNYVDWTPTDDKQNNQKEQQTDGSYNVEDTLASTIVISTPEGDKLPTKMMAVANFTTYDVSKITASNTIFGDKYKSSLSLSEVRALTDDYAAKANASENQQFVMTNAVYRSNDGERVSTTSILGTNLAEQKGTTEDDIKTAKKDAMTHPVKIYIERNVAKVAIDIKDTDKSTVKIGDDDVTLYSVVVVSDKDKKNETYNEKEISVKESGATSSTTYKYYFRPIGWALTATTEKAYLSKHIQTSWEFTNWTTGGGSATAWSDETNHRSYWAQNVFTGDKEDFTSENNSGLVYGKTYKDCNLAFDNGFTYTNENAATSTSGVCRTYPTQAVVAGTLVRSSDGSKYEEATLCEYEGTYYADTVDIKKVMANKIQLYIKLTSTQDGGTETTTMHQLTADDYELVSTTQFNKTMGQGSLTSQESDPRYPAKLCIKALEIDEDGTCTLKYKDGDEYKEYSGKLYTHEATTAEGETRDDLLNILKSTGQALIYKNGMTYYSFKIPHLAAKDNGSIGIVRNHLYQCSVSKVVGFGTPVLDPSEVIYPETPIDIETYIAAQVNILSWKNVTKDINLGE